MARAGGDRPYPHGALGAHGEAWEAALDRCLDDADPDGIDDLEADARELIEA